MYIGRIFLIALITLLCSCLNAQKFIGGSMNFNTDSQQEKHNSLPTTNQSVLNFSISPTFGNFISENTAIGIDLNLGGSFSRSETGTDSNILSLGVSPFIRQYLIRLSKVSLFVHGRVGSSFSNRKVSYNEVVFDKPKSYSIFFEAYPGLAYNVNERFLLQTTVNFFNVSYHYTYSKDSYGTDRESKFSLVGGLDNILNLGRITIGALYKF